MESEEQVIDEHKSSMEVGDVIFESVFNRPILRGCFLLSGSDVIFPINLK